MSRIISALTALTRRLFSPAGPSAATSDLHRAWLSEQMKEYSVHKLYAGPLDADLNPTGETYEMRLAYRKALKEPAIKGPLLKKVYAVASLTPQVLPEDGDHPAGKEAAAWVDYAITHARGGWPRLLHDCCIHPLIEGFAVGEKVAERVERGRWKDRWGLHAVKFKETKDLRFKLDRFRNVESVRSFAGGQGGHEFDTRDFVLLTHMPLWENPFGQSDMRAAYRAINLIEASIKLRAILLENFSGPFLVFKNSQPANVEQARAALSNARSRGYIVIDQMDELQVMNLATSGPDQFQTTIDDLRKEAATAIAGAYLQMLESGSPQGNSETHKGVSELFEWWLASTVAAALTEQLIPDLHDPHYADDVGRPRILLGGVDPNEATKQAEKLKTAKGLGLPLSKGQAYEILELEPPRDAGDALGGEQAPQAGAGGAGGMPGMAGAGGGGPGGPPPAAGGGGGNPPGPQPTAGGPGGPGADVAPSVAPSATSLAGGKATTPSASVPPEILAAMVAAQQAGDAEAVDELADLGSDPAALADAMRPKIGIDKNGHRYTRMVKAFADEWGDDAVTFADNPRQEGEVWEGKGNRWYKRTNGRTVPTANPNADKSAGRDPAAPKRDVVAEAKAQKEAREPGREAARTRWKAAVQDPKRVTADQVKALAAGLRELTRDELREIGRELRQKVGGLKEDVVQRLLDHVGAKGAGGSVKATGQYGAWGVAAAKAAATPPADVPTTPTAPEKIADRPVKVKASTVDTPAQGVLNQSVARRQAARKRVKDLRDQIKNEPLGGNRHGLRLQLLNAQSSHAEAVADERKARAEIERRANELGQTTKADPVAPADTSPAPMTPEQKDESHNDMRAVLASGDIDAIRRKFNLPDGGTRADTIRAAMQSYELQGGDAGLLADAVGWSDDPSDHMGSLRETTRILSGETPRNEGLKDLADKYAADQPAGVTPPTHTRLMAEAEPLPALEAMKPGTADENPDISDRDHKRAVGRLLVGSMHDAERLGKTDAAETAREVLAKTRDQLDYLPKDPKRLTTDQAERALTDMGYTGVRRVGGDSGSPDDAGAMVATDPSGNEVELNPSQVKSAIYGESALPVASRMSMDDLNTALKRSGRGRITGPAATDAAGKVLSWRVTDPDGKAVTLSDDEVKKVVVDAGHARAATSPAKPRRLPVAKTEAEQASATPPTSPNDIEAAPLARGQAGGVKAKGARGGSSEAAKPSPPATATDIVKPAATTTGMPTVKPAAAQTPDDPEYVAAGKQMLADDTFRKDFADAYNDLADMVEYRDGLVEMPRLYRALKKRQPDLTIDQFHAVVDQVKRERQAEVHVLNEVREQPNAHGEGSILRNDRLYHYVRFKHQKAGPSTADAEMMKPAK